MAKYGYKVEWGSHTYCLKFLIVNSMCTLKSNTHICSNIWLKHAFSKKLSNSNTKESVERWSKLFIIVRHIHVAILKMSFYRNRTCCANIPFKSLTASSCTVAIDIIACFIIQTVSTSICAVLSIISTQASYTQINRLSRNKDKNIKSWYKKILTKKINQKLIL